VVNLVLREQNAPRITAKIAEKNKQVNVGDNLDINCVTTGTPEPIISWLFNDQIIGDSNNVFPSKYISTINIFLRKYFLSYFLLR